MNNDKCFKMQERARQRIPGMTQLLSKRPDMYSLGVWPTYYKKANGVEVWDLDDNHYIDMSISGIGANVLGYADPDVDAAVVDVIKNGSSCTLNPPEEVELADLLCDLHSWADKVRYARSGGEAMTIAVRIARAHTKKDKIAFCGYHGWHDWYLSANLGTENALGEHLIAGLDPRGVPQGLANTAFPFRYNQLEDLENIVKHHKDHLAAIIMEPVRSQLPTAAFIEGIRKIADETGAVLIVDEISFGFRINTGGAHLVYGIQPDIAVFSKALGNGYPIAAIIGKSDVMEAAQKTFISSTMWTERIGPAAAIATIKKHKQSKAPLHMVEIADLVKEGWVSLAQKHNFKIHIGGISPLIHFSFDEEEAQCMKAYFIQEMLDQGFLASNLFYAMLAHTKEHVFGYLVAVDKVFSKMADIHSQGKIKEALRGQPSSVGFKRLT